MAKIIVGLLLMLPFGSWMTARIVTGIRFDQQCAGFLKRAADANTVELAREELGRAVAYAEREGLTSGYTSIVWRVPKDDIGFWYKNLKASLGELESIPETATALERTNVLMKLRETLLDDGKNGSNVTSPGGLSIYPANVAYAVWGWLGAILGCCGLVVALVGLEEL